jgi:cell division protein FtsL
MGLINFTITANKGILHQIRRDIMGLSEQVSEMRTAQADLKSAIVSASERVMKKVEALEARIAAAGEPDPDLSNDVAELRSSVEALNHVAADAPTQPTEPEV